jgi:hypothetical protein
LFALIREKWRFLNPFPIRAMPAFLVTVDSGNMKGMNTFMDTERAAGKSPAQEQQQWLRFLHARRGAKV